MKKLLILFTLLGLTACIPASEEKYQYFNLFTFGDPTSATTIRLDMPPVTLTVTEDLTDGRWSREQTAFFHYDILDRKANDQYDIRVQAYSPATRKLVRPKSLVDADEIGNDAVAFYQDWGFVPSKRTFNIACLITTLKNSRTEHTVSLVADDARSNTDTLYLMLHHQGFGETFENEEHEANEYQVETRYLRFDLGSVIPTGAGDKIVFCMEWDWFPTEGGALLRQREHFQACAPVDLTE